MEEVYHRQLSYQVVGCAQRVHAALRPGFPESVYHRALCVELTGAGIAFEGEKCVEVFYEDTCCGEFRCDIVAAGSVVLELKALGQLTGDHIAQALSYLKATGLKLAILINFGQKSLETRRVVL